jgi:hypothetical protein
MNILVRRMGRCYGLCIWPLAILQRKGHFLRLKRYPMIPIYRQLLLLLLIATAHLCALGQYELVLVQRDSSKLSQLELHSSDGNPTRVRIPLDTCCLEFGINPDFAVSGNTLFGCSLSPAKMFPGSMRDWTLSFAVYTIENGSLKVKESCRFLIPVFKSNLYYEYFHLKVDGTVFTLSYDPISKYGGAIRYNCSYYEPGDLPKLYKRFIRMVKQCSKVNPTGMQFRHPTDL